MTSNTDDTLNQANSQQQNTSGNTEGTDQSGRTATWRTAQRTPTQEELDQYLEQGGGALPPGNKNEWVLNAAWWEWFEPRLLKLVLYVCCLVASLAFLWIGLTATKTTIDSMVNYRNNVSDAVKTVVEGASKDQVKELGKPDFVVPVFPESLEHAKKVHEESKNTDIEMLKKYLDSSSLLSVSPIITLLAFLLGVGLTLMLGLMKSVLRSDSDARNRDGESDSNLSVLATPLSKVFEEAVEFVKKKFNK